MRIGNASFGKRLFKVVLEGIASRAWTFEVNAYNICEATDILADYVQDNELNVYKDYCEIADLCKVDMHAKDATERIEKYADAHGLTCCGNHGIYMKILKIEEIAR